MILTVSVLIIFMVQWCKLRLGIIQIIKHYENELCVEIEEHND
jgi:hypothetical protein